jgi:hypothetical protein
MIFRPPRVFFLARKPHLRARLRLLFLILTFIVLAPYREGRRRD